MTAGRSQLSRARQHAEYSTDLSKRYAAAIRLRTPLWDSRGSIAARVRREGAE